MISRFRVLSRDSATHHAFSVARDGDLRQGDRRPFSVEHRVSAEWATVDQVHAGRVVVATEPGMQGEGDALVTRTRDLPVAIFTADCLGLVFEGTGVVGVAHAGWRGLQAGVLEATVEVMRALGSSPHRVTAGPGIRRCCYEVGPEVAAVFPDSRALTTWGTVSVDLMAESKRRLPGLVFDEYGGCTGCDDGHFSYRNGATVERMVAMGWLR